MRTTSWVGILLPVAAITAAAVVLITNEPDPVRDGVVRVRDDGLRSVRGELADITPAETRDRAATLDVIGGDEDVSSDGVAPHAFPIYGDVDVLPRVSIAELQGASVGYEEGRQACRKLRALAREHTQRVLEDSPELLTTALDTDAAGTYCAGGGVLLIGVDPELPRELHYIPCPPEHAEPIYELQAAYEIIATSPDYRSGSAQRLGVASLPLGDNVSSRVVPGSTLGSYRVLGEDGSVLISTYDNVPGVMHPSR